MTILIDFTYFRPENRVDYKYFLFNFRGFEKIWISWKLFVYYLSISSSIISVWEKDL